MPLQTIVDETPTPGAKRIMIYATTHRRSLRMWNYDQPGHPTTIASKLRESLAVDYPEPRFHVSVKVTGGARYFDAEANEPGPFDVAVQLDVRVVQIGQGAVELDIDELEDRLRPIVDDRCRSI